MALFCGFMMLSACTKIGLGVANAPTMFFDGQISRDIVYDKQTALSLDVYTPPAKADSKPSPVVVFLYGGRWSGGDKKDYAFVGTNLAKRGFVTIIPNMRHYPDVRFPAFVEDAANAVVWAHENSADYGGNKDVIFISGHSSGAHVGSLLVADERYIGARSEGAMAAIEGFAGLAGPYDFTPQATDVKDIFSTADSLDQIKAGTFIDGREPPMLLLHGRDDTTVGAFNLERFEAAIKAQDGNVQSIIYDDVNHVDIVGAIAWVLRGKAPVLEDMTAFFTKNTP